MASLSTGSIPTVPAENDRIGGNTAGDSALADSALADSAAPEETPESETVQLETAEFETTTEPSKPKKRRRGLWIGTGIAALVLVGAGTVASLVLLAPGTVIAGVPVGWMTPGMATEAVNKSIANTNIQLGASGPSVTGAELGAAADTGTAVEAVFANHALWQVGNWFPDPVELPISLDADRSKTVLQTLLPAKFVEPTNATVVFDPAAAAFASTPAVDGTKIDIDTLARDFSQELMTLEPTVLVTPKDAVWTAPISSELAEAKLAEVAAMVTNLGFYIGEEKSVPVDAATAATWFQVTAVGDELVITPSIPAISASVDALPGAINRDPVTAEFVVNSSGEQLRELTAGVSGRVVGTLAGFSEVVAESLEDGIGVIQVPITETAFETTGVQREIAVNLSSQRISLIENGEVIDSWSISSGASGTETTPGNFRIGWKTSMQNMGNRDLTQEPGYFQPDVPWVMYFNGDEALHGVYWHSNWGSPMSHGCVGMPIWRSEQLYNWTPQGVDVSVFY